MSLVRAERRRFTKRRMVIWTLIIGVLFMGAIAGGTFLSNQKVTPEVVAAAEAQADRDYQMEVKRWESAKQQCDSGGTSDWMPCEHVADAQPQRDWFQAEYLMPPTFQFRKEFGPMIFVWGYIMTLVAFVIGATFVGAEWRTGAMMNLLTWRPRRWQVLGTKLGVLLAWLTGIGVATFGLWTAAMWSVATFRGTTEGMTSGAWQSAGITGLRGFAMMLAAGAVGFALASVGRHTAVPLVGVLALGIVNVISMPLLYMAQVAFPERYVLPTYLHAWLDKSVTLENWNAPPDVLTCGGPKGCQPPTITINWQDSALLAGVGLVLILGLAFWQMRRRDVT